MERRRADVDAARADLANYPDSDGRLRRLARALVLYGLAMRRADQLHPAKEALLEARGLQVQVVDNGPDDLAAWRFVATIDERLADVYDQLDETFIAYRSLESAVASCREVARRSHDQPTALAALAKALTSLALHLRLNGEHEASTRLTEAVDAGRQACEEPHPPAAARRALADALKEQSDSYAATGDRESSYSSSLERVRVLQPLADDAEATTADRAECATALRDLAEAALRRLDLVAARETAEEAVERLERLTGDDEKQLTLFELGQALGTLGSVVTEQGHLDDATRIFDRLERLADRLAAIDDSSTFAFAFTLARGRLRLAVRQRNFFGWLKRMSDFNHAMKHTDALMKNAGRSRRNYFNRSLFGSDTPTVSGALKVAVKVAAAFAQYLAAVGQARLGIRIPGLPTPAPDPPAGVPEDPSSLTD